MTSIDDLQTIPGVGPSLAADLRSLGVRSVAGLRGRDPGALYRRLRDMTGVRQDPCVLYAFRCAVYFAETPDPEPELCKWWNWKGRTQANETDEERAGARPEPAIVA